MLSPVALIQNPHVVSTDAGLHQITVHSLYSQGSVVTAHPETSSRGSTSQQRLSSPAPDISGAAPWWAPGMVPGGDGGWRSTGEVPLLSGRLHVCRQYDGAFHLRASVSSYTDRAVQGVEELQLPVDSLGDTRHRGACYVTGSSSWSSVC